MTDTIIRDLRMAACWEPAAGRHVYREHVDVLISGDRVAAIRGAVGDDREAPPDGAEVVDGTSLFLMPGLINAHAHPHTEPANKGVREDHGRPEMFGTGLYERSAAFNLDAEGRAAGAELSYGELLLGGVTGLVDLSAPFDGWIDLLARSGLRGFVAPGFASARWYLDSLHQVKFRWDEAAGEAGFAAALALIDEVEAHPSGRLTGVVFPGQIDTCTESLLRDAFAAAEERDRPFTTHISQAVMEFREMVDRHGKTPIQWAHQLGLLSPRTVLGHAIFIDDHPSTRWHTAGRDISILADSGATVAHCPSPFARYGEAMADFGRYLRSGVNMAIGTDVAPHNVIEEMRLAILLSRLMARDLGSLDTAAAFHAATVGAADALGRPDLGRIAEGAKADLVLVDLAHPAMQPARDPLRTLVFEAAERAVRHVYVDGVARVRDGAVLGLDMRDAGGRLAEAQARMLAAVPERDFLGRSAEDIAPLSLPRG